MSGHLRVEDHDGIRIVTIDRPEAKNALHAPLRRDLRAALGVVPTWGLTALLPRAVGVRKAREMSVTGAFVDAGEASRVGLVNHVVPHEDLLPFTLALAGRVPPTAAVGEMLDLYRQGQDLSLTDALDAEARQSAGRTYDLDAFTDAGRSASARQRGATPDDRSTP